MPDLFLCPHCRMKDKTGDRNRGKLTRSLVSSVCLAIVSACAVASGAFSGEAADNERSLSDLQIVGVRWDLKNQTLRLVVAGKLPPATVPTGRGFVDEALGNTGEKLRSLGSTSDADRPPMFEDAVLHQHSMSVGHTLEEGHLGYLMHLSLPARPIVGLTRLSGGIELYPLADEEKIDLGLWPLKDRAEAKALQVEKQKRGEVAYGLVYSDATGAIHIEDLTFYRLHWSLLKAVRFYDEKGVELKASERGKATFSRSILGLAFGIDQYPRPSSVRVVIETWKRHRPSFFRFRLERVALLQTIFDAHLNNPGKERDKEQQGLKQELPPAPFPLADVRVDAVQFGWNERYPCTIDGSNLPQVEFSAALPAGLDLQQCRFEKGWMAEVLSDWGHKLHDLAGSPSAVHAWVSTEGDRLEGLFFFREPGVDVTRLQKASGFLVIRNRKDEAKKTIALAVQDVPIFPAAPVEPGK